MVTIRSVYFNGSDSPIKGMMFWIDRKQTSENSVHLLLKKDYLFGHHYEKTEYAKKYLAEMFNNQEIRVVLACSMYNEDWDYIDCVYIRNVTRVRQVLDILKANKVITQPNEEIDLLVQSMEENINYCSRRTDSITEDQVACIRDKIETDIKIIVQYAKNKYLAWYWIKSHEGFLEGLESLVFPKFGKELRQALINVANVYSSTANLEEDLAKQYVIYLPSQKKIKKAINDMLNESFSKKELDKLQKKQTRL